MPFLLLIIFIAVPIAEIVLFIEIGERIGVLATVALVVITAILGTTLLRMQGLATLYQAQNALNEGRLPVESVIDGAFLLVAGILLLTPGFLTDAVGFSLFVPPARRWIAHGIFSFLVRRGHVDVHVFGAGRREDPSGGPQEDNIGPIIEGEIVPDEKPAAGSESAERIGGNRSPWRK